MLEAWEESAVYLASVEQKAVQPRACRIAVLVNLGLESEQHKIAKHPATHLLNLALFPTSPTVTPDTTAIECPFRPLAPCWPH